VTEDVKEISLTIHNQKGLHARAAAKFVNVTSKFESEIKVSRENEEFEYHMKNFKELRDNIIQLEKEKIELEKKKLAEELSKE